MQIRPVIGQAVVELLSSPVRPSADATAAQLLGHFSCGVLVVGEAENPHHIAGCLGHRELAAVPGPGQVGTSKLR